MSHPTIEFTILDLVTSKGRISKKLFEKLLLPKIEKLEKQNEIMREALADIVDSYFDIPPELRMQKGLYECERSKRARKALKQIKEIEG